MDSPARPRAALAVLASGAVIAGKYAIVNVVGEGGMGIVYEATHLKLRQRVAVKMLQREMLAHEIIVSRFEREARAAGQLRNRHTARVMDVDITADGLPYMVMEFLEGNDLEVELGRRGRFAVEDAVDCVLQACSAMIEAHQVGIIHRDLKPANLFLAVDGDARIIKVLDFGISKVHDEGDSKLTTPDSVMGTALYMSPEQVRSSGSVDERSDIWSLGIILYELLSGRPPWTGTATQLAAAIVTEDPPDILALCEIPLEMVAVIGKALKRDPDERYADVKGLAVALAPFASSTGPGRIIAEGLLNTSRSDAHRRIVVRPSQGGGPHGADAVSESRMGGEGTTPGWSQHRAPSSKRRTAVVGMVVAFVLGFVVLGVGAVAYLRWGAHAAPAQSASAAARSVAASASAVDPLAAAQVSTPGAVAAATASTTVPPGSDSVATTHARVPVRGGASATPPRRPPATLQPKPPVTAETSNPIHL